MILKKYKIITPQQKITYLYILLFIPYITDVLLQIINFNCHKLKYCTISLYTHEQKVHKKNHAKL